MSLYKETYPDVAIVRNEIKQLQAMTTEDYIALFVDQETAEGEERKKGKRKLVDSYKIGLLKQREDLLREKELVHHRQARIAADIKKYEARIDGTTVHQQELMSIQRDYENLQKNYQALVEKKLSCRNGRRLGRKTPRNTNAHHRSGPACLHGRRNRIFL